MQKLKRTLAAITAVGTLLFAGCSTDKTTSDGLEPTGNEPTLAGTLLVSPDTVLVEPGSDVQFVAMDSAASGVLGTALVSWSATAGTVDSSGLFHAPSETGPAQVNARANNGTSKSAVVSVEGGLSQQIAYAVSTSFWIEVTPGSVTLAAGKTAQFSGAIKTSDGKSYGIIPVWTATGGTITSTGLYTAPGTAGTYKVILKRTGDSIADTATVTVTGASSTPAPTTPTTPTTPTAQQKRSSFWIETQPATVTLAKGASQQFTALGKSINGKTYGVQVNWRATGGTVSSTGLYKAPSTNGTYRVIATRLGDVQTDTSVVTVGTTGGTGGGTTTPPPATPTLSSVVVTPATASVAAKATQQFSAAGKMSDGSTGSVSVTWSATGGTISTSGLYTAGATAGSFRVIAVQQGGTKADTSAVTVTGSVPPPVGGFAVTMPEGPRVVLNTAYTAPTGASIAVASGSNLQTALNGANCGDELVLAAGATFTGNFVLPVKGCGPSNRIQVRSAGTLPAEGQRMTPAQAGSLAKIVSPNSDPALRAASGASGFRVMGVELTVTAGVPTNYGIVSLGASETTLSQQPTDLIFDRVYIHGNPSQNVRRGVALNDRSTAIIDSYIADIHEAGSDNQGIGGWLGAGPFKIVNNYIAAAGQNIMFGGADPAIANVTPSDIEIRHNHLFKPLAWQTQGWQVKNIVEFKHAQRVVVEGNVLENHWVGAQAGFAVVMFSVNQNQTAPWTVVQDILWQNNVLRNIPAGFNLAATNSFDNQIGQPAKRIALVNNLLERVGESAVGGVGRLVQVLGDINGVADVTLDHNTLVFSPASGTTRNSFVTFSGPKAPRLTIRNNIVELGSYGIIRVDGVGGSGTTGLNNSADPWQVTGNVWAGSTSGNTYPSGNPVAASTSSVGFTNMGSSDYSLSSSSSYRGQATDGTDPGYNRTALLAATQGVVLP